MGSNIVADTVEDGRPPLDVTLIAADQGEGTTRTLTHDSLLQLTPFPPRGAPKSAVIDEFGAIDNDILTRMPPFLLALPEMFLIRGTNSAMRRFAIGRRS